MINAKRFVVGILALVLFGLFLVSVERLDPVIGIAREVLPTPQPAATQIELPPVDDYLPPRDDVPEGPAAPPSTLAALDAILTTNTHPPVRYERSMFGPRWADVDRNGCDTRNDMLARDLRDAALRAGDTCIIVTGILHDPYTAAVVDFDREADAAAVPIDHVVALSWAWQNGAYAWDDATRTRFANDPLNLQATTRSANSSKGDHGPSKWLPTNDDYRCDYLARFVTIVATYELTFPEQDRATTRRELATC